jgi:hypothetical protein
MSRKLRWVLLVPAILLAAFLLSGGRAAVGGQEEETAGNNLSFPVIWGEAAQLSLQGNPALPVFDGGSYMIDGVPWYVQKDPDNLWQAETTSAGAVLPVTYVDWGDNLESQDWRSTSKVRVETVLFKALADFTLKTMTGYTMQWLDGSGTTEIWGTNGVTYGSSMATIYSEHARLTIQRIDKASASALIWNADTGQWEGLGVLSTDFNGGCWEGVDGPGGYSAEINVSGKAIYGYNWDVRTTSNAIAGTYRITFSLDATRPDGNLFTTIDASTQVMTTATTTEATLLAAKGSGGGKGGGVPSGGGTAVIDAFNNLTYIDVTIKSGRR